MTRVLVTGAAGFMGRHALATLATQDLEVHGLDRRPAPDGMSPEVAWHNADLLDASAVRALLAKVRPDRCLHMAWDVSPGFWTSPANQVWATASWDLLLAFAEAGGTRFVGAGSCAEYDWAQAAAASLAEDAPRAPATPYGEAKDETRRRAEAFCDEHGLSFAWGIVFFAFGPDEQPGRLVPSIVRALLAGEPALCTAGTQVRDFMDCRDIGAAFAALTGSAVTGNVNLASGEGVSVADVATRLGRITGYPELIHLGALSLRPGEPARLVADVRRMRNEIGFRPARSLDEGLAEAVAWWRERL